MFTKTHKGYFSLVTWPLKCHFIAVFDMGNMSFYPGILFDLSDWSTGYYNGGQGFGFPTREPESFFSSTGLLAFKALS